MRFAAPEDASSKTWDAVVIGSGFGSLFFLRKYLELRPQDRVLIVERGDHHPIEWQLRNFKNSTIDNHDTYRLRGASKKPWAFTIALGGSTNCWWALSPRFHPSDFRIRTLTGAGVDWPIAYEDLQPYYAEAEEIMLIAGPDDLGRYYPGADGYPQPAHRLSTADRLMHDAPGSLHFAVPSARLSQPVGDRARCCSTANCWLCPTGAKFSALNGMRDVLDHPGVTISLNSRATAIDTAGGVATGVRFTREGREYLAKGDLVVLGANAIHAPDIFNRSGIPGYGAGRFLGEKMLAKIEVDLDGLDHFDGGTATTGFNITLLEEGRAADRGMAVYYFDNRFGEHGLRMEKNRWRQTLPVSIYVEDNFAYENGVFDEGEDEPVVRFSGFSDYCRRGLDYAMERLPAILAPLPVESIRFTQVWPTLGHVQGTLRMGASIADSVIDRDHLSHAARNLVVVGTSTFPTSGSVNPSLTAAAMSLRAADRLVGSAAP